MALALLVGSVALPVGAQTNVARAEDLFRQGKALLEQKSYDQACPMFAESARLDPSSGVELALGLCYEGQGKTASAWGAYSAAETLARRDARHDREAAASEKVKSLEPLLSRVTFTETPAAAAVPGVELYEDGTLIASVAWADSPVDPGPHTVEVRALGHVPFTTVFNVKPNGDKVTVSIPALAPLPVTPTVTAVTPAVAPPPPVAPPPDAKSSGWRTVGFVGIGTGGASLIVASVLGAVALSKASDVHHACAANPCSDSAAVSENQTAGTFADASTGLFVAGGVIAAAGLATLLFAPPSADRGAPRTGGLHLTPALAPGYAGLRGDF